MANFCVHCGKPLQQGTRFCPYCGYPTDGSVPQNQNPDLLVNVAKSSGEAVKKGVSGFVNTINDMTGEKGEADIKLSELISEIPKRHTKAEADVLFTCGTTGTTPLEKDMIASWPKPWLFSRVLLYLLLVFVGLYIIVNSFHNPNGLPGMMFIGAMLGPFPVLIFLWECNVPRNISLVECVKVFFIGGVFSLISTLIVYEILGDAPSVDSVIGAMFIGIAEEVGKFVIAMLFINRARSKYILNGLVYGACIGAGFAVFETAGYIFRAFLYAESLDFMMDTLVLRAVLAVGGHVVWTAMICAGYVAAKGEREFDFSVFLDYRFFAFAIIAIVMHGLWDSPIDIGTSFYLVQWILTVIALVIVIVQVSAGLRQVSRISREIRAKIGA